MTIKANPLSPVRNLFAPSSLFRLFQRPTVTFSFALLCLVLSLASAQAQTRPKRTRAKSEERVRRVDDQERVVSVKESGKLDNAKQVAPPQSSLVRKTALTYSPRTGNQSAVTPTLTNDIIIISRAPEASSARSPLAPKTGSSASSNIPSIWPVVGPLRSGVGLRSNPFGGSSIEFHKGQDISAPTGTPVSVTADGVVVIARWVKGYGNGIYVDHGNGISTRYGHLSRIDVAEGQTVKRGQQIGLVGSTGRSTGPHLHYEVRINGQAISPLPYLPSNTSTPGGQ